MPGDHLLVLTTSPDQKSAEQLAEKLVDNGLAACVNILPPMQSIYWWKGKRQSGQECQLFIKTRRHKYSAIEIYIRQNHPYELPEIIAIPIEGGLPGYLQWITDCCEEKE